MPFSQSDVEQFMPSRCRSSRPLGWHAKCFHMDFVLFVQYRSLNPPIRSRHPKKNKADDNSVCFLFPFAFVPPNPNQILYQLCVGITPSAPPPYHLLKPCRWPFMTVGLRFSLSGICTDCDIISAARASSCFNCSNVLLKFWFIQVTLIRV